MWGFDYLKYDWCGYGTVDQKVCKGVGVFNRSLPYRLMGEALAAQNRDIVYSLCQYGMAEVSTWGENVGGNCWRTTVDITDTWPSMSDILDEQAGVRAGDIQVDVVLVPKFVENVVELLFAISFLLRRFGCRNRRSFTFLYFVYQDICPLSALCRF